jgi:hypothetical protein
MDEIYRSLGRERENDLIREAEKLHCGARLRRARREQRGVSTGASQAVGTTRESLRTTLRRIGVTLRPARG